ncbi:hypothetical protein [Paenarthrobacter nicotinovorans]|uniref:hypothetical protein n=1 Tax=Paenarthrobacter nicotinovorans TaxID=29320 RepID=UPI0011AA04B2|nr:hypothetical protein [Paenarthrobacter nicotinovorans]
MGTTKSSTQRSRVIASLAGLAAIAAFALTGALQILVWNPLAAVPGASLEEIHEGLAKANESLSAPGVVLWALIGTGLGAAVVAGTATRRIPRMRTVVLLDLLILGFGAPSYFCAAFPAGMALADAFLISGGDHAPWGGLLYLVSAAALAAALTVAVMTRRPRGPRT